MLTSPLVSNVRHRAMITSTSSAYQGCGIDTQILGSGSSSGHLIFWLRLQQLETF